MPEETKQPVAPAGKEAGQRRGPGGKPQGRRRNQSRYGIQIREKKELKSIYGIREEQLRNYYRKALAAKAETAPELIRLLERRIDNVVFRAGFAQTRPQARQLVSHGYFLLNGRPIDVPSALLEPGDTVTVKESKRAKPFFTSFDKRMQNVRTPSWIVLRTNDFGLEFAGEVDTEEVNPGVDMRAIIEFFTR